VVAAIVCVGFVVTLFVVWGSAGPKPVPTRPACLIGSERPCSENVAEGKAYRYQVPHCGLIWIVDFDGSHWDVDKGTMNDDENQRFGINSDQGTMTLEGKDLAVYRSFGGGDAALHRHSGPLKPFLCA